MSTRQAPFAWPVLIRWLLVALFFIIGTRIPLPGIALDRMPQPGLLAPASWRKASVFAVGPGPVFIAHIFVQLICLLPYMRRRSSRPGWQRACFVLVIAFAFAITAVNASSIAKHLLASGRVRSDMADIFVPSTIVFSLVATALFLFLSARLSVPGLASGVWMLMGCAALLEFTDLAGRNLAEVAWDRTDVSLIAVLVFPLIVICLVVAHARLWRSLWRAFAPRGGEMEPRELIVQSMLIAAMGSLILAPWLLSRAPDINRMLEVVAVLLLPATLLCLLAYGLRASGWPALILTSAVIGLIQEALFWLPFLPNALGFLGGYSLSGGLSLGLAMLGLHDALRMPVARSDDA